MPDSEPIKCKALVSVKKGEAPTVKEVSVDPPGKGEVRIKMVASGICHTDLGCIDHDAQDDQFPLICGHEATGIVESVGPEVRSELKKGDTVMPYFLPFCGACPLCKSKITNFCQTATPSPATKGKAKLDGKECFQVMSLGTFAEYSVISQNQVVKLPSNKVPPQESSLMACCLATSVGSVQNFADVQAGTVCGVWGLGTIGLGAIAACKARGARMIIGIDTNPEKFEKAQRCGATHVLNPKDSEGGSFKEKIQKLSPTCLDYAFECVGAEPTLNQALDCLAPWGTMVIIGVCKPDTVWKIKPKDLLTGKRIISGYGGGFKGPDAVREVSALLEAGKIPTKEFISQEVSLEEGPKAIEDLRAGKVIRSIIKFQESK